MPDGSWLRRLRGTIRSRRFERDLAAELDFHLTAEADLLIARGVSPEAARVEAHRRFGSLACASDACRDAWGLRSADALLRDVRVALRAFVRHPAHALIAIVTLALGIGAATAIFSVVRAVLIAPLPYEYGDRLVEIRQQTVDAGIRDLNVSALELADYRSQTTTFDAIVEYHQMGFNLVDQEHGGAASRVVTGVVSAAFFDVVGIRPLHGRTFRPEDDSADAEPVLMLSYEYWQRMFGGDPRVIGRRVGMNDRAHTVVGVLPPVPMYPDENDVYMPVAACPFRNAAHMDTDRGARMSTAIGRLRPGVTLAAAERELAAVAARMAADHPNDYAGAPGFTASPHRARDQMTDRARRPVLVLLAATLCVLGLVCANVANMMLARLLGRRRELALRAALGAGRGRIRAQLIAESLTLATAGGALGVAIALVARGVLVRFIATFTPLAAGIAIDPAVVAFAVGLALATGLVVGLAPGFQLHRPGVREACNARSRAALLAAQVALSVALLSASMLLLRSFANLRAADVGFHPDHVLTVRVDLDWVKYDTAEKRRAYFRPLLAAVQQQPGVVNAALGLTFPLNPSAPFDTDVIIDGDSRDRAARARADFRLVSPGYFDAIGMRVLRGRAFTSGDRADAERVAIVNESMARHELGRHDAIGRRLSFDGGARWHTIVGVVNDVRQYGLRAAPVDEVYLPFDQQGPLSARVIVRTSVDPDLMAHAIQHAATAIDPAQPLSRVQTLDAVRNDWLTSPRTTATLVTLLALVALLITATGIGGVTLCRVRERTVEIGIRVALGARSREVIGLIAIDTLGPVAAGILCGFAATRLGGRFMADLLFGVTPADAISGAIVIAAVGLVSALACIEPARRAAAIDPTLALRAD